MNETALKLARKLKALADRGVGGEKENAIAMLQRFMIRHEITHEMLEGKAIKKHVFFLEEDAFRFFNQIVASETGFGGPRPYIFTYKTRRAPGKIRAGIEMSDEDFIFIMAKFEFYHNEFKKDLEIFYSAFIQKNQLWTNPGDEPDEPEQRPKLTPEEKQRLFKTAQIMEGLERKTFHKQLK